ncbi:hypothetical protein ACVW04_001870 [Bradyrhizobium sp. LM2.3]
MPKNIFAALVDRFRNGLAGFAEKGNGEARQDRDQQHLQEIAACDGAKIAVGDDRHQMGDDAFLLGLGDVGRHRLRIDRGGIDVKAAAGLQHLADQ